MRDRWRTTHPRWEIVVGDCPDGPWRKGVAVRDAASRASGEVFVVADADVWTDGITNAVQCVCDGAGWAIPHHHVRRLTAEATRRVLAGGDLHGELARKPYPGFAGGGMFALPAGTLQDVPMDSRFAGWGQEDEATALALTLLAGKPWRGTADMWHLWHEPAPRQTSYVGSQESLSLLRRYQQARTPKQMRALLAEANT